MLFLDNLRKTKLSQGKPPIDFGDVYQSAARTPQSTTQAGFHRSFVDDLFNLIEVMIWTLNTTGLAGSANFVAGIKAV